MTVRNPGAPEALERARDAARRVPRHRRRRSGHPARRDRPGLAPDRRRRRSDGRSSRSAGVHSHSSSSESAALDPDAAAFAAREWQVHDVETYGPETRWERDPFAFARRRDGRVVGVATGWTGLGVAFLSELLVGGGVSGARAWDHTCSPRSRTSPDDGAARTLALRTEAGSRAAAFYGDRGWTDRGHLLAMARRTATSSSSAARL